jgi:hypothetical protein
MNEVEVYKEQPVSEMAVWARDANEIAKMAAKLVQTSFVPQSYNGKPAEATAAILTGMEVGLKPMAALRSIDVVNGTPALRAQALRGLVQAAGHKVWVEESTSQRAVVKGIRRGDDQVQTSVWDVERARQLGLLGKPNYQKQAQAMFVARATSEICRLIASDVIMGLAYSIEEVVDDAPVAEEKPATKAPSSRTARRKPLPVKPDEPPLPEEAEDVLREADEQDAHQNESLPANGSGSREVAAGSVEAEPVFDDALAQKIEAQMAAERREQFDEPALDGEWDETK